MYTYLIIVETATLAGWTLSPRPAYVRTRDQNELHSKFDDNWSKIVTPMR